MAEVFNDFPEIKARTGVGAGLYSTFGRQDGKYALVVPTIETPFIESEYSSIEVRVTNSPTVGQLVGAKTLNTSEANVYMHRDVIDILENISGQKVNLLSLGSDMTGYTYQGIITYTPNNAEQDDAWQGTVTITPVTDPQYVRNAYPLIIPTAHFLTALDGVIQLATTTGTYTETVTTKYADTTVTAASSDADVATVAIANGVVTITGVAKGSAIISLTTSKTGYASWTSTSLVIVP